MDSSRELEKQQQQKNAMDSIEIFNSIITDDEYSEEEYRRNTRKRIIIIVFCMIVLVMVIIGATIGILTPHRNKRSSVFANQNTSIEKICNSTLYAESCFSSISSLKMTSSSSNSAPDTPDEVFMLSLRVVLNELMELHSYIPEKLVLSQESGEITQNALNICNDLVHDAVRHVNMSVSAFQQEQSNDKPLKYVVSDIRTWLSTAITDQETCLDGLMEFKNISRLLQDEMRERMKNSTEFTSNSLAIISNMYRNIQQSQVPARERLFEERLLAEVNLVPNLTVSKDGSGNYRTISDAVNAMPKRSEDRFFIYVKEGEYKENVVVDSDSWNLMIYGDGMNKTTVSASKNVAGGVATYLTATLIVQGRGFIAKDMGFLNKAGPNKLQAAAVRSSSDQSIFQKCYFEGYQNTLYAYSNRQFYHGCLITGSIDFIFGNAAAVFQNCTIRPRQLGPAKPNIITAQGKSDPNQNVGFSIQQCVINSRDDVKVKTFLGRPWKSYSMSVITESDIGGIIDPSGWTTSKLDSPGRSTLFYAEYNNTGPGSVTTGRVKWAGYRPSLSELEAQMFSIEPFIQGSLWLMKPTVLALLNT